MKGVSLTLAAVLLTLITIAAGGFIYTWFSRTQSEIESKGSQNIIIPEVAPKISQLVCFTDYAYFVLANSQGQKLNGRISYLVEKAGEVVRSGSVSASINDTGRVYLPGPLEKGLPYKMTLTTQHWSISDFCMAKQDPTIRLRLKFDTSSNLGKDSSSYGNDASIYGAGVTTGISGQAISLNGTDNVYAKVQYSSSLDVEGSDFTLLAWVNGPDTQLSENIYVIGLYDNFGLRVANSGNDNLGMWYRLSNTTARYYDTQHQVLDSSWHQIAVVRSGNNYSFYDNAVLVNYTTLPMGLNSSNTDRYIGSWTNASGNFNGTIDEVMIYGRALSSQEISLLYSSMT